jgi:hypothetical protein
MGDYSGGVKCSLSTARVPECSSCGMAITDGTRFLSVELPHEGYSLSLCHSCAIDLKVELADVDQMGWAPNS